VCSGFADDFFGLPEAEFPYLLALARGVRSPAVQLAMARRRDQLAAWHSPELRDALRATLERFVTISEAYGFAPVILWIPQAAHLRHALRDVPLELETAFVGRAALVAVAGSGHDWARFAESGCHPSREGYGIIARHVAAALEGL
jgi:lysophospholipase L1-like esterase